MRVLFNKNGENGVYIDYIFENVKINCVFFCDKEYNYYKLFIESIN